MPATEEQIVIEFTAEYSSLDGAVDTLEKAGAIDAGLANSFKKTTSEMQKQEQAAKKLGTAFKGPITSIDQLDKRSRSFVDSFVKGFEEGVKEELLAAKEEIDAMRAKFEALSQKGGGATKNLKKELKDLTAQIAQAKATGGPVSQEMIDKAGNLKDAIADANAVIKTAGSDTRGLDTLIGTTQALAGGFAVAQGAAALFGAEDEELQKTLLKVNAAMSVMQGLQQIQNALQKEGAIQQLAIITQEKIYNAQLALEGATQSKNIVVKYAAIAAQKALNAAVSVNPYLLIITALLVVIPLIAKYAENTREAAEADAELNSALRRTTEGLADQVDFLTDATERRRIAAEKAGASEVDLIKIQIEGLKAITEARRIQFEENQKALAVEKGDTEKKIQLDKEQDNLRKQARKDQITADKLFLELQKAQQKELDDAEKKRLEDLKKAEDKRRELLAERIAKVKQELLLADETKKSYKTLEIALINLQAEYDAIGQKANAAALIQTEAALKVAKIQEPVGKAFKATLDESQKAVGDTTKALEGFAQSADVAITATLDTTAETFEQFLNRVIPAIQDGLTVISTLGSGINNVQQEQMKNQEILIDNEKAKTDELLKAGSITEKEAEARQERLAQKEKVLRRQAAKREKDQALFGAFINMAQGIVGSFRLLPPASFINAALVAALGGAQIAAIANRPLPNFFRGKKSKWEGLGRYGEAGSELRVNADGTMEYATKPTVKYIGPDDIILNPYETSQVMSAANDRPVRKSEPMFSNGLNIDYNELGLAIGRNTKRDSPVNIHIEKSFIREEVAAGLSKTKWFDTRYSFRK